MDLTTERESVHSVDRRGCAGVVCGRSLAGIAGSNSARVADVCLL
jgi:hypothetical protein